MRRSLLILAVLSLIGGGVYLAATSPTLQSMVLLALIETPFEDISDPDDLWAAYLEADSALAAQLSPEDFSVQALEIRAERDQLVRNALLAVWRSDTLSEDSHPELFQKIIGRMSEIDAANLAWMKTRIASEGYFLRSRDGDKAADWAFLIVQHQTDDPAFMADMLARFETLRADEEVHADDYALLFDRVAILQGRPQRYGSQTRCADGEFELQAPLEDPDAVDKLRSEVGLLPLATYLKIAKATSSCN